MCFCSANMNVCVRMRLCHEFFYLYSLLLSLSGLSFFFIIFVLNTINVKHWTLCYCYSHRFPHISNHIYKEPRKTQTNKTKKYTRRKYFPNSFFPCLSLYRASSSSCDVSFTRWMFCLLFSLNSSHPFFTMRYEMSFMLCLCVCVFVFFLEFVFRFHTHFFSSYCSAL